MPAGIDLLVIDDYDLDRTFESSFRPWARTILVIDDIANRAHDADILIDQNIGRERADYDGLVPTDCRILTGPGYGLIASDYSALRTLTVPRIRQAGTPAHLVVSFGGSSVQGLRAVLDAISDLKDEIAVTIVLPSDNHADEARIKGFDVRIGLSPQDMAQLTARADIALGAGGISLLERCCLGVPSIVLTVAENQRDGTNAADAAGACRYLGDLGEVDTAQIESAIDDVLSDGESWRTMSRRAASVADGFGVARLSAMLNVPDMTGDGRPVALRRAREDDMEIVLEWQRDPTTRKYARNPKAPSEAEHRQWFANRLADGACIFNIVECDGAAAGVLRLDRLSGRREGYEVSILVDPKKQGRRIASIALRQAEFLRGGLPLWANVLDDNVASAALFKAQGYRMQEPGWYVA